MFGDQVTSLALPLVAVLVLRSGAAQMGILTALVWLPSLLFGMHMGAWADRHGHRRRKMIGADIGRAVLLGSVPVSYALGVLTIWQLYAVAFAAGTLSVLFTVCNPALFVAIVPAGQYVEGNSLVYGSRALSFVSGPSAGGVLVQLLTAPLAIVADALSFVGSAFFLSRINPAEAPATEPERRALTAGVRFIRNSPIVRSSLVAISFVNFFDFVFLALFVLYATRSLHIRAGLLGLVLGAGAVGGVVGAVITKRLTTWLGAGWVYTFASLVFTAPLVLVPLASGGERQILVMLFSAEFISGLGLMALDISIGAIFAEVIPDKVRSRVNGAFQMVNYGTRPLGALAGGFLGAQIGLRPTLWIATVGATTGFLWLVRSPLARFRLRGSNAQQDGDSRAVAAGTGKECADNVDGPGGLVDPVDHLVSAAPRGVVRA